MDNTRTSRQDVVFTFSRPVDGLTFSVTDLDSDVAWRDAVQLTSPTAFTTTLGAAVAGAGTATNPWRATGGALGTGSPAGNVNITMTAPVSSFTLSYWNINAAGGFQGVFISPMTFRVANDCT